MTAADPRAGDAEETPYTSPLAYPGTTPSSSGLVVGPRYREIPWAAVDAELARLQVAPLVHRTPVVAVGSNAAPAQLRAKLAPAGRSARDPLVVPMAYVELHGLAAGVSAHVSRPGYVPATPVPTDGEMGHAFVVWLDPVQLAAVDRTEPSYDRVRLPEAFGVLEAVGGAPFDGCDVYVSRHGCLLDTHGRPRRLVAQRALLQALLDESEQLRGIAGECPESWVTAMRDRQARAGAQAIWRSEGRVRESSGALTTPRRSRRNKAPPGNRLTVRPGDQSPSPLS
ncbi:hypothetical protein [Actinopolymorpha sp. B9G3]|uniref:hypothetical protein n=1 Tax=Actinopolymorpha sp. B9G3 TaxID=3158970 RepID=UPI0032D90CDB